MDRLELVIVQDLFMTATARRFADVFFPACSSFEKEGTFMNAERRIQRVRRVMPPAGASKSDWEILCAPWPAPWDDGASNSRRERRNDLERGANGLRGARADVYARLETGGLQWPCPDESHPGSRFCTRRRSGRARRAAFSAVEARPPAEAPTAAFPFLLITGRTLYQFNAATMTGRSGLD